MFLRSLLEKNVIKSALSVLLGVILFFLISSVFIGTAAAEESLSTYLHSNKVKVGVKKDKEGYPQIFYEYKDEEREVTETTYTNAEPEVDGEYVVWMSQIGSKWQIFLHNIPSDKTIQLTNSGVNVNPDISGKYVAWEGFVDGVWQIFIYDGVRVKQITDSSEPNQGVQVFKHYVVYTRKVEGGDGGGGGSEEGSDGGGDWEVHLYDLKSGGDVKLSPFSVSSDLNVSKQTGVVFWNTLEDGELVLYQHQTAISRTAKVNGPDGEGVVVVITKDTAGIVEEEGVSESTESTSSESVGEGEEGLPGGESSEPGKDLEGEEEEPEKVTEEDIKEELGITDEKPVEESTPSEDTGEEEVVYESGGDSETQSGNNDVTDEKDTEESTSSEKP